jgi:hypothetical protein
VHALAQLSGSAEVENLLERFGAEPVTLEGIDAVQAAALRLDEPAVHALVNGQPSLTRQAEPLLAAAQFGRGHQSASPGAPVGFA